MLFFALDDSGATPIIAPADAVLRSDLRPEPGRAHRPARRPRGGHERGHLRRGRSRRSSRARARSTCSTRQTGQLVGSFPLGPGNPGRALARARPDGLVAVAGSADLRELYAVDVRGLAALPPRRRPAAAAAVVQRRHGGASAGGVPCLRSRVIRGGANPIVLPPPPGSSGVFSYVPSVRFGRPATSSVATSYNDGGLAFVGVRSAQRDSPARRSCLRASARRETLAATGPSGVIGAECCPGPLLLRASGERRARRSTGACSSTASPNGFVVRGHLGGSLAAPTGDADGDGVEDALDVCPLEAGSRPGRRGRARHGHPPDGVGDACQCGDVSNDGRVDVRRRRSPCATSWPGRPCRSPRPRSATSAGAERAAPATSSMPPCCAARSPARRRDRRTSVRRSCPEHCRDVDRLAPWRACGRSPESWRSTRHCARATTCGSLLVADDARSEDVRGARRARRGVGRRGAHRDAQRDRAPVTASARRRTRSRSSAATRRPTSPSHSRAAARSGCWSASRIRATSAW